MIWLGFAGTAVTIIASCWGGLMIARRWFQEYEALKLDKRIDERIDAGFNRNVNGKLDRLISGQRRLHERVEVGEKNAQELALDVAALKAVTGI